MSYENIRLSTPVFCSDGNYFYSMQPSPNNMLIQKTGYGDPVMTYPLSHEIDLTSAGTNFLSMQYDGIDFWTLEKRHLLVSGTTYNNEVQRILRRWRIESLICNLKDSWLLRGQGTPVENMTGSAFAIESYQNVLAEASGPGTDNLDRIVLKYPLASFFHVNDRVFIKSSGGSIEEFEVLTTPDHHTVVANGAIQNVFYAGASVVLRRDLYYFNDSSPSQGTGSAALYRFSFPHIDSSSPTDLNELNSKGCHDSGIYQSTSAATFITASGYNGINSGYYAGVIGYIRGQQLLLKRPGLPTGSLSYPGPSSAGVVSTGFDYTGTNNEFLYNVSSMIFDNALKVNKTDLWAIPALATSVDPTTCITVNIYRLQLGYTIGSTEGSWSTYNYVTSVMRPMVTSIALTAEPALVVANGVDTSFIWCTVRDQYGAAINGKRVVFSISTSDSDVKGYFLAPESISSWVEGSQNWLDSSPHALAEIFTGSQSSYPGGPAALGGQAVIEWRAGTKAGISTVVAVVQP